jgi:hypothetical protein
MRTLKCSGLYALGCVLSLCFASASATAQSWTEDFTDGVGRFDQTLVQGDSLFSWDAANGRLFAEFRRPAATDRRAATLDRVYGVQDTFGFSVVITPLDRNASPLITVTGFIGFFNEADNNLSNSMGIYIRDDGSYFGIYGPGGIDELLIPWIRFQPYFIEFRYDGKVGEMTWSFYEGTSNQGILLGTFVRVPADSFEVNQVGVGSNGGGYDPPTVIDAYIRAGIDNYSFDAELPDPTVPFGFSAQLWYTGGSGTTRGVAIGPGGTWGTDVYFGDTTSSSIMRLTGPSSAEVVASGLTIPAGAIYGLAFDRSGLYGGDLIVASVLIGNFGIPDVFYRVSSDGNVSLLYTSHPFMATGMAFGQGAGFGDSLYILDAQNQAFLRVEPDGTASTFGAGLIFQTAEDDVVITNDAQFGNAAYVTDSGTDGGAGIWRMSPSGVTTRFTDGNSGQALAQGSGAFSQDLYHGSLDGKIFRVDASGALEEFASGFGDSVRSIAFDDNIMFVVVGTGNIYRIVPTEFEWKVEEGGNGHRYRPVAVPSGLSWSDASDLAIAAGGHLATITSDAENEFIFSLVDAPEFWNVPGNFLGPWLGGMQPPGTDEPDVGWEWITGESFAWYDNWLPGEPNDNATNDSDFLHFFSHDGRASTWNDRRNENSFLVVGYVIEFEPDCVADYVEPFGVLDIFDIFTFLGAFSAHGVAADLAEPYGVWDFFDVMTFLEHFAAGCP